MAVTSQVFPGVGAELGHVPWFKNVTPELPALPPVPVLPAAPPVAVEPAVPPLLVVPPLAVDPAAPPVLVVPPLLLPPVAVEPAVPPLPPEDEESSDEPQPTIDRTTSAHPIPAKRSMLRE